MVHGWGPLAGVCGVLLLIAGTSWPRHNALSSGSTAKALVDPSTAIYEGFDPASATLKLVQVVFRHGARTPLNTIYGFQAANWTHCRDHYKGVEVQLYDENGGAQPPPILDMNTTVLPGGCREGTLTEAGYGMATDLGAQLRRRYVEGGGGTGPTAGFLPDMDPATLAAAATSGTAGAGVAGWDTSVATLRTTPIRRTVATLRGVLTGLWPRLAEQTAPLPVGASLESLEIMYGNNNTCPVLGPLHEAMQRDLDAADARNADLPRQNRLVAEALGLDPEQAILWSKLYDILAAMIADGAPLPAGATREVLDIVWVQAERHEAAIIGPGTDVCNSLGPGGDGPPPRSLAFLHTAITTTSSSSGSSGGDASAASSSGSASGSHVDARGSGSSLWVGAQSDSGDSSSARTRRCHEVLRLGIGMLVRRLLDNMEHSVAATEAVEAGAGAGTAAAGAGATKRRHLLTAAGWRSSSSSNSGGGAFSDAATTTAATQQEQQQRGRDDEGASATAALPAPSKLYLFSGHDSSVTPLLAVLGQPALAWPPFTANLIFELWQAGSGAGGSDGGRGNAAAVAAEATAEVVGRRGLGGVSGGSGAETGRLSGSLAGGAQEPEYWVRILYDGSPLVVPGISNAGGWAPLGILRQRVLLPYAIRPIEHSVLCAMSGLSELLSEPRPPSFGVGRQGGGNRRSALVRERAMRHVML